MGQRRLGKDKVERQGPLFLSHNAKAIGFYHKLSTWFPVFGPLTLPLRFPNARAKPNPPVLRSLRARFCLPGNMARAFSPSFCFSISIPGALPAGWYEAAPLALTKGTSVLLSPLFALRYGRGFLSTRYTRNNSSPTLFKDLRRSLVASAMDLTPMPSAMVGAWRPPKISGQSVW